MRHAKKNTTGMWRGLLSLVVLALLGFTLGSVAFSGASFTAPIPVPDNVFVAGSLLHTNNRDGQILIAANGMAPGDSSVGTMTLSGGGTLDAAYTFTAANIDDVPGSPRLSDALRLTVEDITAAPQTLYSGPVSAFSSVPLGSIAVGASRTYRITLAYPAGTALAALQGASLSLALSVTGVAS